MTLNHQGGCPAHRCSSQCLLSHVCFSQDLNFRELHFNFYCQNNFGWFRWLLLHPSLYIDFLLSGFFFNKSVFAWQKMPCVEIQASMKHRFSLVELKHSKSLSKLQLKWYIQNVLNQMFAFHLHFGFYSKSSEIYFRVLKMSFSSRQDLTSFSHGWGLGGFFHRLASGFMNFEAAFFSTVRECPEPDHKGCIHTALWPWTWHLCTRTAQWMMGGACTKMAAQTIVQAFCLPNDPFYYDSLVLCL